MNVINKIIFVYESTKRERETDQEVFSLIFKRYAFPLFLSFTMHLNFNEDLFQL